MARAIINPDTGCWEWSGSTFKHSNGGKYGKIKRDRRTVGTHVAAYEVFVGPVPDGLVVDHLCENTLCLNPAHLQPKTHRANILRGTSPAALNARKTHCKHGHEFDLINTRFRPNDRGRECRACDRQRQRQAQKRNQADRMDEAA
jgi:hypothetical protein